LRALLTRALLTRALPLYTMQTTAEVSIDRIFESFATEGGALLFCCSKDATNHHKHHLAQYWSEFQTKKTVRMLQIGRSTQRPRDTNSMPTHLCYAACIIFSLSLVRGAKQNSALMKIVRISLNIDRFNERSTQSTSTPSYLYPCMLKLFTSGKFVQQR